MAGNEFEKTYGTSAHARMVSHVGEGAPEPVDDLDRRAVGGQPPVAGAQWDEVHRRWERWDESAQTWVVVGEDAGDGINPADENPVPPLLARELLHADEIEKARHEVADVERGAEPTVGPLGAQWNEVESRWERWDAAANDWVEITD